PLMTAKCCSSAAAKHPSLLTNQRTEIPIKEPIMSQQATNDLLEILSTEFAVRTLDDCEVLLIGGGETSLSSY
ncbi:MAG: hypothetical protein KA260_01350, partial [Burkholderiales bacterium]|nr:hypothetical protein [Burkholderiales bacterium]